MKKKNLHVIQFKMTLFFMILWLNSYGQPCLPNGITFTCQTEVDSFPIAYPNCSIVEGKVTIEGLDIINLNGLNSLTAIGGGLHIENNPLLNDLTGLSNITSVGRSSSVGEDLSISFNPALISLAGLDNLSSIGGELTLKENGKLTSLLGLQNLDSIGVNPGLGNLEINNNDALLSLSGLDQLTYSNGIYITGNDTLPSLSGLENLTNISFGGISITSNKSLSSISTLINMTSSELTGIIISNNKALTSLSGLENVTTLSALAVISNNGALTDLTGLDNLSSSGTFLSISRNPKLGSLSALSNLETVGTFSVSDNDELLSLDGLSSLKFTENIWIRNNDLLNSLSGLLNLKAINGTIAIEDNKSLTSLSGLDSIDHTTISEVFVKDNTFLSVCHVKSICNFILNPDSVNISNNFSGCNSIQEVEAACNLPSAIWENVNINQEDLKVYPNPTKGWMTIELPKITFSDAAQLSIHDVLGKLVFNQRLKSIAKQKKEIDLDGFDPGVYWLSLHFQNRVWRKPIVVL